MPGSQCPGAMKPGGCRLRPIGYSTAYSRGCTTLDCNIIVINGGHCDQTERGDREGTMKKIGMLALLVAATPAAPALAWFDQGHMMVAAVAYDQLTPKTKARVAKLLALNKYPTNGANDAGASDKAKAAFMMAATDARRHQDG